LTSFSVMFIVKYARLAAELLDVGYYSYLCRKMVNCVVHIERAAWWYHCDSEISQTVVLTEIMLASIRWCSLCLSLSLSWLIMIRIM